MAGREMRDLLGRSERIPLIRHRATDTRLMSRPGELVGNWDGVVLEGCRFENVGHGVYITNKTASVGKSERPVTLASVQKAMKSVQRLIDETPALPPGFSLDNADMTRVVVPPEFPMPVYIKTRIA